MSRISDLVKILTEASLVYYGSDDTIMSDAEFDRLRDELESLDPDNDFLKTVGASVSASPLQKVKLTMPMGSLKKISWDNGASEFATWMGSVNKAIGSGRKLTVQHKLDGLSIQLEYRAGKLFQAVTRGDGQIGEDVTHNLKNAKGVVKDIGINLDFFVRGEVIINIDTWKTHLSDMKNPRNAAAGIARRKSDISQSKYLNFVSFDIVVIKDSRDIFSDIPTEWKTVEEQISWLNAAGFNSVQTFSCRENDVEDIVKNIRSKRDDMLFEIDGCVIKVNRLELQHKMGEHDGRPYWARAWKFESASGSSVINSVSWGVGTRGTIDPVAHIIPCEVMGVTISNVTLHNMDEIDRLSVCIGDCVEVVRAGDVIPKIVRVIRRGVNRQKISCPVCPSCGSSTKKDGPVLRCTNMENCSGVQHKRIAKWIKKRGIMYLGDSALEKLIECEAVTCILDLYKLDDAAMILSGIGSGMSSKIQAEIDKSRKCSLADLLGSLSIDLLGRSQAQNIIDQGFGTLKSWAGLSEKSFGALDGFGSGSKAARIWKGVKANWTVIKELYKELDVEETEGTSKAAQTPSGKLTGKSFVFTGAMSMKRPKMEELVVRNGGSIASGVNKALDYLVISDPSSTSSKAIKARKLGIVMISECQFMDMIK